MRNEQEAEPEPEPSFTTSERRQGYTLDELGNPIIIPVQISFIRIEHVHLRIRLIVVYNALTLHSNLVVAAALDALPPRKSYDIGEPIPVFINGHCSYYRNKPSLPHNVEYV